MVQILCGEPKMPRPGRVDPELSESELPDSGVATSDVSGTHRLGLEQTHLDIRFFAWNIPPTFTIHQDLLCRYSRFFRQKLHQDLGSEIVADCLRRIECSDTIAALDGRESKYLSHKDAPAGYVPSWLGYVQDYRRRAEESSPLEAVDQPATGEPQTGEAILLDSEPKDLFAIFVHWLYTQTLVLDDVSSLPDQELLCARVYGMAERLDVPALRQQCYDRLYRYYGENNTMPQPEVLEVIIKDCTPTSLLRKYMVAMIAHEIITQGNESKESCDPMLALDKSFAAEVALEIMDRLRSDKDSADPNSEDMYDVDDSDSDISSSIDVGSDIAYDTDGYMSISDGEEEESVVGDASERHPAPVDALPSSSELPSLNSDQDASVPAFGPSKIHANLPRVKIEADSTADHALLDVNANKRKRPSHSFGDNENPRTKRLETHVVVDADFVDLTQWANSD